MTTVYLSDESSSDSENASIQCFVDKDPSIPEFEQDEPFDYILVAKNTQLEERPQKLQKEYLQTLRGMLKVSEPIFSKVKFSSLYILDIIFVELHAREVT